MIKILASTSPSEQHISNNHRKATKLGNDSDQWAISWYDTLEALSKCDAAAFVHQTQQHQLSNAEVGRVSSQGCCGAMNRAGRD
eukprot:4483594-Amphidinium_carterae.1